MLSAPLAFSPLGSLLGGIPPQVLEDSFITLIPLEEVRLFYWWLLFIIAEIL